MIGTSLSHFRITAKIGEGGMGEVYLAEDTELDRKVALKVLPQAMADDPERLARFEREAKAVAALNHPNIVTIYSIEESDGTRFLTMELIEGQSLDNALPAGGFPLSRFFEMATPLADALAAAHDKGIVHRDLKPANVMVTAGDRVKVLDFGLAKLATELPQSAPEAATQAATLTTAGTVMGTAAYMSPEQLHGKDVDARSDIFSLGILLHEMATGQRPFQGESAIDLASSILRDTPEPVTEVRAELPRHLGRIIQRCLEKNPEDRYQSAKDVRIELAGLQREITSGPSSPVSSVQPVEPPIEKTSPKWPIAAFAVLAALALSWWVMTGRDAGRQADPATQPSLEVEAEVDRPRLVVIPFENLGTPDNDYFAAGMTEELTSRLASVPGLAVVSRKSALHYTKTDKSMAEIGQELDVAYVLEGTVRWAPTSDGSSRVRITPQLIDVSDDAHVWSDVYDREIDDVFEIQSEIAQQVVSQLGVALLGEDTASLEERPTDDLEAYQAYLRGIYSSDSPFQDDVSLRQGVAAFEEAVELDPGFALAWAKLSELNSLIYHMGYDMSESRRRQAVDALDEATRLAPQAGETDLARGYYHYWGFKEYETAVESFQNAADKLPDPTPALIAEAYVQRRLAGFGEAVDRLDQALERNPRDSKLLLDQGETLAYARRFADASASVVLSAAIQPVDNWASGLNAWIHWLWKGPMGLPEARTSLESSRLDRMGDFFRYYYFWQMLYERQAENALAFVDQNNPDDWIRLPEYTYPQSLFRALALDQMDKGEEANAAYEIAAAKLENEIERAPDDFRLLGPLGIAYASLGRDEEALAVAEQGAKMMPLEKDALVGPARLWELAAVHARLGNADAALDIYETLIDFTGAFTVPFLELDIYMDPIREHSRFKALVDGS